MDLPDEAEMNLVLKDLRIYHHRIYLLSKIEANNGNNFALINLNGDCIYQIQFCEIQIYHHLVTRLANIVCNVIYIFGLI